MHPRLVWLLPTLLSRMKGGKCMPESQRPQTRAQLPAEKPKSELMERAESVQKLITDNRNKIATVLAGKFGVEKFSQIAMLALSKNDKLFYCSPASIVRSVLQASILGLQLDVMNQGHLVPFKDEHGRLQAQLIPGYQGLVGLVLKADANITNIESAIVFDGDEFHYELGDTPRVHHKPAPFGKRSKKIIGAYAVAFRKEGTISLEPMDWEDLEKIRLASKAPKSPAYKDWPEEQHRKAPIRRLCKHLLQVMEDQGINVEMARKASATIDLMDRADLGQGPAFDAPGAEVPTMEPEVVAEAPPMEAPPDTKPAEEALGQPEEKEEEKQPPRKQGGQNTFYTRVRDLREKAQLTQQEVRLRCKQMFQCTMKDIQEPEEQEKLLAWLQMQFEAAEAAKASDDPSSTY